MAEAVSRAWASPTARVYAHRCGRTRGGRAPGADLPAGARLDLLARRRRYAPGPDPQAPGRGQQDDHGRAHGVPFADEEALPEGAAEGGAKRARPPVEPPRGARASRRGHGVRLLDAGARGPYEKILAKICKVFKKIFNF
mgnify:CR=1 FL=1